MAACAFYGIVHAGAGEFILLLYVAGVASREIRILECARIYRSIERERHKHKADGKINFSAASYPHHNAYDDIGNASTKALLFETAMVLNINDILQPMIRVSDITVYLKCPRMCYFVNRGHSLIKDRARYVERMIFKELALTYGEAISAGDKLSFLDHELDRISDDIRVIYRNELSGMDEDTLAGCVSCVRLCLGNVCCNLSPDFYSRQFIHEPLLQSEKFGLSGSPDRLVKMNDELLPSIIKTGSMPQNGAWKNDRLQLTAYAILVEENYDRAVKDGFVEYARSGEVREVVIKRHERRKVLQIRDKIKKIQGGAMPEKPEDAPCNICGFTGMCDVKPTLASRFF